MLRDAAGSTDALVLDALWLVAAEVRALMARLPAHVSRDDLLSAGNLALVEAARGYDEARGVPFARFAAIRIRGALVDELRSMDWASRSVRGRAREVEAVRNQLAVTLGRSPRPQEVADTLGVSVSELGNIDADVHRASVLSVEGLVFCGMELPDGASGPERVYLDRELRDALLQAVADLPERQREAVVETYLRGRTTVALADELGVTTSWVWQLRRAGEKRLRHALRSFDDDPAPLPRHAL